MLIKTKNFGEREIDEDKIITFEDGIPGFYKNKRFITFTESEEEICLIWWLQSVDDGDLAFPLLNTFAVIENYNPEVDESLLEKLGKFEPSDLIVCNILVVPEDMMNMTTNLKAPIIINSKTRKGMQIIVNNSEYEIRHNVYQEIKRYNEKAGE